MGLDARQVPEQDPVAMKDALWRAGRARGIDEERRGLPCGLGADGAATCGGHRGPEIPCTGTRINRQDVAEIAEVVADARDLFQIGAIGHERDRAAVLQAIGKPVWTEEREERHHDRADLVGGEVDEDGFGGLRQHEADPLPFPDPGTFEHHREFVGEPVKFPIREDPRLGEIAGRDDRGAFGCHAGPEPDRGFRDVEVRGVRPREIRAELVPRCRARKETSIYHVSGKPGVSRARWRRDQAPRAWRERPGSRRQPVLPSGSA